MSFTDRFATSWLPPAFASTSDLQWRDDALVGACGEGVSTRRALLSPASVAAVTAHLRAQRTRHLATRPLASIVESLDRVAAAWLDPSLPERRAAVEGIARATGFSRAMVAHALDLEFESSRGPHLLRALASELGDPGALDGFVPDLRLGGRTRAVGPALVGGVASANIPGLPHLTITRALVVKAACLMRSSRHEPLFLPLFAATLARIDPELGECVAVLDFDPGDAQLESAFLGSLDHLIAYGGTAALDGLRLRVPPATPATWHGHRLGFALVAREALDGDLSGLAERLAYDFSLFDREACLSPQVCFVEAPERGAARPLASAIARAMSRWAERLPPARFPTADRARFRQELDTIALRAASGDPVEVVAHSPEHRYAVVIDELGELRPAPRGRFVRIVPIADALEALPALERARSFLQVAAIEDPVVRLGALVEALAVLGISRITRPGLCGLPSMMWRHDGIPCLATLVRWVGEELTAPRDRP